MPAEQGAGRRLTRHVVGGGGLPRLRPLDAQRGVPPGLAELVTATSGRRTAIMCSEAVWWRCHRRIISDIVKVEYDVPVEHLMHNGRLTEHRVSDGARTGDDGRLVWDDGLSA